jgi:hypothetical protein
MQSYLFLTRVPPVPLSQITLAVVVSLAFHVLHAAYRPWARHLSTCVHVSDDVVVCRRDCIAFTSCARLGATASVLRAADNCTAALHCLHCSICAHPRFPPLPTRAAAFTFTSTSQVLPTARVSGRHHVPACHRPASLRLPPHGHLLCLDQRRRVHGRPRLLHRLGRRRCPTPAPAPRSAPSPPPRPQAPVRRRGRCVAGGGVGPPGPSVPRSGSGGSVVSTPCRACPVPLPSSGTQDGGPVCGVHPGSHTGWGEPPL